MKNDSIVRFWSKVDMSNGPDSCWNWTGCVLPDGYGFCGFDSRRNLRPHRVAFEIANPGFDKSMYVCHRCDNTLCCNPSHLFAGTQLDNMRDKTSKSRQARGAAHGMHKLSIGDVMSIREARRGGATFGSIGIMFGISTKHAWRICTGNSWSHVD